MLKPSQLYEFLVKMICCHFKNLFFNLKIQYFEAKPEVIFLKKWNEMDNFPIFNNDIKVLEDVPTLYFNFKMQRSELELLELNQSARTQRQFFQNRKFQQIQYSKSQEPWIQINPRK